MKAVRVLCIHTTGAFGGASRSLYEALSAMSSDRVKPMFLTQKGSVVEFFSRLGPVVAVKGITQFDNTRYSYYRGFRWLVLLRELAYLPNTIQGLRRARKQFGEVDVIHLNEFTGLPALWLAKKYFNAPALVHVRSVVRNEESSWRTRLVNYMFRKLAAAIVVIDQNVRASLPVELPVKIIHNSFHVASQEQSKNIAEALDRLKPGSFKVGFVGNLLRVKGIMEFAQAAAILHNKGLEVEFVVVGDDAAPSKGLKAQLLRMLGLQQNIRTELESFLDANDLRSVFHMLGFTASIGQIYNILDVLCFPSHYDAPGRPIFEAAFYAVPSIVAVRNPQSDTLVHMETGIAITPGSVNELAEAIESLVQDQEHCKAMGAAAKALAQSNFNVVKNSEELHKLYQQLAAE